MAYVGRVQRRTIGQKSSTVRIEIRVTCYNFKVIFHQKCFFPLLSLLLLPVLGIHRTTGYEQIPIPPQLYEAKTPFPNSKHSCDAQCFSISLTSSK